MEASKAAQPHKKPYAKPTVRVFGNVRALTRASGSSNLRPDGQTGKYNKT